MRHKKELRGYCKEARDQYGSQLVLGLEMSKSSYTVLHHSDIKLSTAPNNLKSKPYSFSFDIFIQVSSFSTQLEFIFIYDFVFKKRLDYEKLIIPSKGYKIN